MPNPRPLIKFGTKLFGQIEAKPLSSAAKRLAGSIYKRAEWEEAKTISTVKTSGKQGGQHWFVFTDKTALPVSAGEVHMRCQSVGSGVVIKDLEGVSEDTVLQRARMALARNAKMMESGALNEFWPRRLTKAKHNQFLQYINETNVETVPYVLVRSIDGRTVPLSKLYAEALERNGEAKIISRGRGRAK